MVFSGSERQRCTAHLQRNAKHLAKRSEHRPARILYGELPETMRHARIWTAKRHLKRERYRYGMLERMDSIIQRHMSGNDVMAAFGRTLEGARNSMFTFVIHPDVPSTNNGAENAIQKCVMHRNARGQTKSKEGARMLSIYLTCFETWRIRGLNMFAEMAKYIPNA